MRPDSQLDTLLGLTSTQATLSDAYVRVDTSTAAGSGIVSQAMQFHGIARAYTLNGATRSRHCIPIPPLRLQIPPLRSGMSGQAVATQRLLHTTSLLPLSTRARAILLGLHRSAMESRPYVPTTSSLATLPVTLSPIGST